MDKPDARSPELKDLPPPPPGKVGWPWDHEPRPSGIHGLPRITVVVPSYNQATFIEETLRSILLQGYPDLEVIVMDGGSTDETVPILERYDPWLSDWVSEPDGGQTHAVNKGWKRGTGAYVTWLNSDDLLLPGCLLRSGQVLADDESADIVYCDARLIDEHSRPRPRPYHEFRARPFDLRELVVRWRNPMPQQGFLMRRSLLDRIGYLDESFEFTMDFEYWVRVAVNDGGGRHIPETLAAFRHHGQAKSSTIQSTRIRDRYRIYDKVYGETSTFDMKEAWRREARLELARHAVYIAYAAGNASDLRRYAREYLHEAGAGGALYALPHLALSLLGSRGLRTMRKGVRMFRRVTS